MSNNIEKDGNWLYFDYKYIGEKVDEAIFQVSYNSYFPTTIYNVCLFYFSPYHGKNLVMTV